MRRITSIDTVRGIVVVIMAIDHSRDLLLVSSGDPTNLLTTTPSLFLTRWITHFCAPIFVFLAGTSAFLLQQNQKDLQKTKKFLLTRGIWLLVLELTVINLGIWFDLQFRTILLQVIFSIGASFVILSFSLRLGPVILGTLGLAIVLMHNLLDTVPFEHLAGGGVIRLFFFPNLFKGSHTTLLLIYPVIPWLGIMLCGFASGKIFLLPAKIRVQILSIAGFILIAFFVSLRFFNFYGDPAPWKVQTNSVFSILSFLNVTKYPPSLHYTLVTLGGMCLMLALCETKDLRVFHYFRIYGRVPMFFYLIHWYVIHVSMLAIVLIQGFSWSELSFGSFGFGRPGNGDGGLPLVWVYIFWIALILLMYPLCLRYGKYKTAHPEKKWLAYI